jgi:hypothetical protein
MVQPQSCYGYLGEDRNLLLLQKVKLQANQFLQVTKPTELSPAPSFHVSVIAINEQFQCRTYPVVFQVVLLKTDRKWNSNWEINKDAKHLIGQGSCTAKCQIV